MPKSDRARPCKVNAQVSLPCQSWSGWSPAWGSHHANPCQFSGPALCVCCHTTAPLCFPLTAQSPAAVFRALTQQQEVKGSSGLTLASWPRQCQSRLPCSEPSAGAISSRSLGRGRLPIHLLRLHSIPLSPHPQHEDCCWLGEDTHYLFIP